MSIVGLQSQTNRKRDFTPGAGATCLVRAHTNQIRSQNSWDATPPTYYWDVLDYESEPGIFVSPYTFNLPTDGLYLFDAMLGAALNAGIGSGALVEIRNGIAGKSFRRGSVNIPEAQRLFHFTYQANQAGTAFVTLWAGFNYYNLSALKVGAKNQSITCGWSFYPTPSPWIGHTGPDSSIAIYLLPDPI